MPNPKYIGTFPVTIKEVFESKINGLQLYSITEVYQNNGSEVYGDIGNSIVVGGFFFFQISNSSDAKDGLVQVTRTYAYAPPQGAPDLYEYQCNAVASEEPIETHPNFLKAATTLGFDLSIVTASGGFLAEGSTSGGAVFDADGIFLAFNKDALNNLAGVRSYLSPQVTFQVKYATDDRPSSGTQIAIGTRSNPYNPPSVGSGKNWLLTEVNWTNTGNGGDGAYEITEGYRLSGEGGWNPYIYS